MPFNFEKKQPGNQSPPQRVEYIDIAKGLLITLVVVGHVWRATYNNGIFFNANIYHIVDGWIYIFHMPAFFFLSGLFAMKSVQFSSKKFIENKLRTIAYPYLLWSLIQSVLQLVLSGSTTSSLKIVDILKIPIAPVMQFWFLYALFFIFLFFIIMRQISASPAFFLGTGVAFFFLIRTGYVPACLPIVFLANNFIYFAAGIFFMKFLLSDTCNIAKPARLLVFLIPSLILACFAPSVASKFQPELAIWFSPVFAIPGVVLTLIVAMLLQASTIRLSDVFLLIGKHSLEIFVAHTIFSAGFRIVALKLAGINSLGVHLVGASIAGLAGPLFLVYLADRLQFRYLFTFPSRRA